MKNVTDTRRAFLLALSWLLVVVINVCAQEAAGPRTERVRRPIPGLTDVVKPQPPEQSNSDPAKSAEDPYSVHVQIRYKKELGYLTMSRRGPNSCSVFGVHYTVDDGSDRGQLEYVADDADPKMSDWGEYYTCTFHLPNLRVDLKVNVTAKFKGLNSEATGVWLGGSQAEPPAGSRRVIAIATKSVTLTHNAPRPTLTFDMVYSEPPLREAPVRKIDIFKRP